MSCKMRLNTVGKVAKRYVLFVCVGATGVLIDMTMLYMLADPGWLKWDRNVSKCIAAEAAILNNFTWNHIWTFRDVRETNNETLGRRLWKFHAICLSGVVLSVVLINAQMSMGGISLYAANGFAIGVVSIFNFSLSQSIGWRSATMTTERH